MNLIVYILLILVSTYPKISDIKIMKYYIDKNSPIHEIIRSQRGRVAHLSKKLAAKFTSVERVCLKNPFSYFKNICDKKDRKNPILTNTPSKTEDCIRYCSYVTWYKIDCSVQATQADNPPRNK